ncbi:MAG: 6-pyruvoyl trahydropterin synthase family protein [Staphylococcus equorum]
MNTTAENIAFWIWEQFDRLLPENNKLQKLEFFETETQGLVITSELMEK